MKQDILFSVLLDGTYPERLDGEIAYSREDGGIEKGTGIEWKHDVIEMGLEPLQAHGNRWKVFEPQQNAAGFIFDEIDKGHCQRVRDPDHGDGQRQIEPKQRLQQDDGDHLPRHGDKGDEKTDENAFGNGMPVDAQKCAGDLVLDNEMAVFLVQAAAL